MDSKNVKKLRHSLLKTYPLFLRTFDQARSSKKKVLDLAEQYDRVYLVIEEEGDMDDQEILGFHEAVKIYAGKAWTGIHKARVEEGLYQALEEKPE